MHIVIALLLLMGSAQGVTLSVCQKGCNYGGIQAAIDASNQGDIIEVQSGMYYEQISLNKEILLKGIDTGGGRPLIQLVYLCGHPDSMITGISFLIMNYGYPSLEQSLIANNISKQIDVPPLRAPGSLWRGKGRANLETIALKEPKISQNLTKPKASGPMISGFGKDPQILYYEDFSYSQPIIYPSDYHREFTAGYQARKFHIRVLQANCLSIYDPTKRTPFKDFSLEVEVAKENGPDDVDYGVVLRRIDANCYYRVWISGSGSYGFEKLDNGQSIELIPSTKSPGINTGNAANQIRVDCYGNHFAFKVNGNEIGNFTDESFSTGEIGFGVRTHLKGGAEVSFDNLKIYA